MKIKGKITRQIDVDKKQTDFIIYIYHKKGECGFPIGYSDELASELSLIFEGKISAIRVYELVEKYLEKVGRINSNFTAVRYHDDVKLTNSFISAFKNLINEFIQLKLIENFNLRPVKVNMSLYLPQYINEGIVTCEVPVVFFEWEVI
jgi:hypothetical protein